VGLVRAVKEVKQSGILWGFRCGYAEVSCCVYYGVRSIWAVKVGQEEVKQSGIWLEVFMYMW